MRNGKRQRQTALWLLGLTLLVGMVAFGPSLTWAMPQDEQISEKVKAALSADPVLNQRQILVMTFNRRVQLTGFVNTQREADKAVQLVRGIDEVKSVQDNLMLSSESGPNIVPPLRDFQSPGP